MAMDSNELVTPADLENELLSLCDKLDSAPVELQRLNERVKEARRLHKRTWNLAYARAQGTQLDRRVEADLATEDTAKAVDDAEILYRFAQDEYESQRTKLRALQSASSLMKAAMWGPQSGA